FRIKRPGEELPTDVHERAQLVVDGRLDVRDIPDELMTPELMQAIIALMIEMRFNKEPEKDDEPEEELFNPAVAAVNEQNFSCEVSDRMLTELYGIIEKLGEQQGEENVTILDGISEPIDPNETLASVATGEIHAQEQAEKGAFEQIIDSMVEESDDTAQIEGTPVIQTQAGEKPTANEVRSEVPDEVAVAAEQTAQTVAPSEQSDGAQMQFSTQTQKAEVVTEVSETDRDSDFVEVIESFTVKEANVPESVQTERPQTAANVLSDPAGRVQNASEELEMLKNAKQLTKANDEGESIIGVTETNAGTVQLDQPIVFTRDDGTEIEVKPSEIVEQTAKIIERAAAETKEQREYSLVLNPEELGRITVKLIKAADGAISVTIAVENAHTQRVLEQHSELMQNNLRSNGLNLESWQTVNESQQETFTQDYNGSSKNPYFRRDDAQDSGEEQGDTTFAEIIASM
ncbi:MAG: flagellar hook-length control protein FliK, partial [Oscillospiraceae bacterium]|nr:flagellar hook-length control protein FliK [Oscillospiraceae bacterium]